MVSFESFIETGVSRPANSSAPTSRRTFQGLPTPDPFTTPVYPLTAPPPALPHHIQGASSGRWAAPLGPSACWGSSASAVLGERWSLRPSQQVFSLLMLLLACLSVSTHLLSHTCAALEKRVISVFLFCFLRADHKTAVKMGIFEYEKVKSNNNNS